MNVRRVMLLALLGACLWAFGCSDDSSTSPGGGNTGTNNAPEAPTIDTSAGAPADGATDRSIQSVLHWSCTDPDGDALTFDIYFGTGVNPPSVASGQTAKSYAPGTLNYSTTYYWKIVAKDPDNEATSSAVWSFTTMAQPAETVSAPDTPSGPAAGETAQSLDYSTGNSTSNLGHSVEYRFDWGNGNYSTWSALTDASYAWAAPGTYDVKAQARCATHTGVESAWSASHSVVVSAVQEIVTTPGAVSGPASGTTSDNLTYNTTATSTSNLGHPVEYRFDWGDGSYSNWAVSLNAFHAWSAAGSYDVKAQARCQTHTTVESGWTAALTVDITVPVETVSPPTITGHPASGGVGEDRSFFSNWATSSVGHSLEHRYDWGDGSMSAWAPSQTGVHAWSADGAYDVTSQARCATHTTVESAWSDPVTITISSVETISTPVLNPASELTIPVGQSTTGMTVSATSSQGHPVEVQWDWGNGDVSAWTSVGTVQFYTWNALGDYDLRVQARCRDHTAILSDWSAIRLIHVVEAISRPTAGGPASGTVGSPITFTTSGATSSEGHALEHRLFVSTSYYNQGTPQPWTTADNLTHTFGAATTWYIRVQARCIVHQTESLVSDFHQIVIQ